MALIGPQASDTQDSWDPIFHKANVPVIGGPSYFPGWLNYPNMYSTTTTIESGLYASEFIVKQAGYKKQALIQCNNAASCASSRAVAIGLAKQVGIDLFTAGVSSSAPGDIHLRPTSETALRPPRRR